MMDESMFKPDDDPEVRARVLAEEAETQRTNTAYPQGLRDERGMWRIGSLSFWKSEDCRRHRFPAPFPSYIRAAFEIVCFQTCGSRPRRS